MRTKFLIWVSIFYFVVIEAHPVYFNVNLNINYQTGADIDTNCRNIIKHIRLMAQHNMKVGYYFTGLSANRNIWEAHRYVLDTMEAYGLEWSIMVPIVRPDHRFKG